MPADDEIIYLDYAATAPMRREALEAMWPWMTAHFANPSSPYAAGRNAREALEQARQRLANQLGCRSGELMFTSGGTESDNLAIKGLALGIERPAEQRRILISPFEHAAIEGACEYLRRHHGYRIERLKVDACGHVDLHDLATQLEQPTALCSIIWAHNEIGTVQRLEPIRELVKSHGVLLHVDAVQAAGWLKTDVNALGVDALSMSGHKVGAGRGIGALFVRKGVALEPLVHGGSQEGGRRGGTEALPNAIALECALSLAQQEAEAQHARVAALRDRFIAGVLAHCPRAQLTGDPIERLPQHASFIFPGTHGESILLALEVRGILCSSGSACKAGSDDPSPSLLALGIAPQDAQTAVRFCLSKEMDETVIDRVISAVAEAVSEVERLAIHPGHQNVI